MTLARSRTYNGPGRAPGSERRRKGWGSVVRDGEYRVCRFNGKDIPGARFHVREYDEVAVHEWLDDWVIRLKAANPDQSPGAEPIPFDKLARLWLSSKKKRGRTRQYTDSLKAIVEGHWIPFFESRPAHTLNNRTLDDYIVRKLEGQAPVAGQAWRQVSPTTLVEKHIKGLKSMLEWAVVHEYIEKVPINFAKVELPTVEQREPTALSPEQVLDLLWELGEGLHRRLFALAFLTGFRLGELLGLLETDYDPSTRTFKVRHALRRTADGMRVTKGLKSPSSMDDVTVGEAVDKLVVAQLVHNVALPEADPPILFRKDNGNALDPSDLRERVWLPAFVVSHMRLASRAERRRFLQAVPDEWRLLLEIVIENKVAPFEAVRTARWSQIDWDRGVLALEHDGQRMEVLLLGAQVERLRRQREAQRERSTTFNTRGWVFPSNNGHPIGLTRAAIDVFSKPFRAATDADRRIHLSRHTYAAETAALVNGNLLAIKARMRHSQDTHTAALYRMYVKRNSQPDPVDTASAYGDVDFLRPRQG